MNFGSLNSKNLKARAASLGFVACGLSPAEPVLEPYAQHYRRRMELGHFAGMDYMMRNVEMRLDPRLLVPGVRSIVSLAVNYMPSVSQPSISLYAQGQDYHDVLRRQMRTLMQEFDLHGRCFVDTAPVLERYWAWRSGVGEICRNGLIAVPGYGPTVFLGELFVMEEADCYDGPLSDCSEYSDGWQSLCPALTPEGLDARCCISYQTIEHRGALPEDLHLTTTFYGCDRCLRACPQFRDVRPTAMPEFQPSAELLAMRESDWRMLTEEKFQCLFHHSAVKRAGYEGLVRNIKQWKTD